MVFLQHFTDKRQNLLLLVVRKSLDFFEDLLDDIANRIRLKARSVDEELFVEELQEIEKGLPSKGVQLVPFLEYQDHETIQLKFNLVNAGNKDIELIELWTVIPNSIQKRNWSAMPVPPALMVDEQSHGNKRLVTFKYSAGVEPARTGYYRPDFVMLPRLLSVGMFP